MCKSPKRLSFWGGVYIDKIYKHSVPLPLKKRFILFQYFTIYAAENKKYKCVLSSRWRCLCYTEKTGKWLSPQIWDYTPTGDLYMIDNICIFKYCSLLLLFFIFIEEVSGWNLGFLESCGTAPSDFNRVRISPSVYLVFHSVYSELHFSLHFLFSALCLLLSYIPPLPPSLPKHDVNHRTETNLQPIISQQLFHKPKFPKSKPYFFYRNTYSIAVHTITIIIFSCKST